MSPEEQVQAVRAALAEVGYRDVGVRWDEEAQDVSFAHGDAPPEAMWRAGIVVDPAGMSCWPCWSANVLDLADLDCTHDAFAEPWPPVLTSGEPR